MSLVLLFNDDYYRRRLGGGGYEDERLSQQEAEELRKRLFPEQKPEVTEKPVEKPLKKKLVKISKADKPVIVQKAKEYDSNQRQLTLQYGLLLKEIIQAGKDLSLLWNLIQQKLLAEQKLKQIFLKSFLKPQEDFDLLAFAMAENKTAYIVGEDDIERLIFTLEKI